MARDVLAAARPRWSAGERATGTEEPARARLWGRVAELGWLGLEVPEEHGGAAATFGETAVVLEEMGRALTACPFVGTAVLGAAVLGAVEPAAGRDDLLRAVGAGECVLAVATGEATTGPAFRLEAAGGGYRLRGRAAFVLDAPEADCLLLVATERDASPVVVAVSRRASAVAVEDQPVLDVTRRFGMVVAEDVEVAGPEVWRFAGDAGDAAAAVARLGDRGALAVALDSLGVAEAMVETTVAYAGERRQFGRPIGSFQAVKHACADMLVATTMSRELCALAVEDMVAGTPDASASVSRAKSHAGAAAVEVAGKAMQLHGGFGYTWESGIHAALKRAALNRSLFGSVRSHRQRLAARLTTSTP